MIHDPSGDLNHPPDGFLSVKEIDFRVTQGVKKLTNNDQHVCTHYPEGFTDYPVARYIIGAE
jgi:hypothetical protein